jgi:hypothetical protein
MKNILLLFTILFSATLFSQNQGTIKGTVSDLGMNSEPLLFANVELKGFETTFQTNFHGNFEISDVKAGEHTLVISYAGYDTIELTVLVENNQIAKIETDLSPMQFSFDDVAGMDSASKEETIVNSDTEESSKK